MQNTGELNPIDLVEYVTNGGSLREEVEHLPRNLNNIQSFTAEVLPTAIATVSQAYSDKDHPEVQRLIEKWASPSDITSLLSIIDGTQRTPSINYDQMKLVRARIRGGILELAQLEVMDAVKQHKNSKNKKQNQRLLGRVELSNQIRAAVGAQNYPPLMHGYTAVHWPYEITQVNSTIQIALGNPAEAQAQLLQAMNDAQRRVPTAYRRVRENATRRGWPESHIDTQTIFNWSNLVGILSSAGVVEARLGKIARRRADLLRGLHLVIAADKIDPNPGRVRDLRNWTIASLFFGDEEGYSIRDSLHYALRPQDILNDPRFITRP